MPLLINEHSVNSAQFFEIFYSEKNARVLGEAMGLPTYVVDEVRRQIKEEGLRFVTSNVVVQKQIDFGRQPITNKRLHTMKTPPAKTDLPDLKKAHDKNPLPSLTHTDKGEKVTTSKPVNSNFELQVLQTFALATHLLMPLDVQKALKAERFTCKKTILNLLDKGWVSRTLNGKYTLSEAGADALVAQFGFNGMSNSTRNRIAHYKKFPGQLFTPIETQTIKISEDTALVNRQPRLDAVIDQLCKDHFTENKPASVDEELAKFDGLFATKNNELNDVPTKIKIIHKIRSHFTGTVGQHLAELEQFLQKVG